MVEFPNADYLRARAVHWRNLAEEVDDPELAAQYEECAATYEIRADSAEVGVSPLGKERGLVS
jgi:hypothetical protein